MIGRPEGPSQPPETNHNSGAAMEKELSLEFLRTVENAAIASARTMGQGDRSGSDQAAVEAMRAEMDRVGMDGTIVIGEGERDEAPMLFIGEKVGAAVRDKTREYPKVDIAVDPLEGTNLCATGEPGAIVVLAASEHGGLLHAPDLYMEKIIVGPPAKGAIDLDAPVKDNLRAIARRYDRDVEDLVIVVLDRPRHEKLIADIRKAGARIRLISDGDLSAGISAAGRGRRRAHRNCVALLERANSGAIGGSKARTPGAHCSDGHQGSQEDLRDGGSSAGEENHLRVHRRYGRWVAARREFLSGWNAHAFVDHDAGGSGSALH